MARAATTSSVTWEVPASILAHATIFAVTVLARCEAGKEPLFKPDEVMTVEMAGPMAAEPTRMPQKAERAPELAKGAEAAVEPPPPNQSDMVYKTKDAPQTKGDTDADAKRQELIDKMRRDRLLEGLDDAPLGDENRLPTGESGAGGPVSAGRNDPELARWVRAVRDAVGKNWHPLAAMCQQDFDVIVKIDLDGSGAKTADPAIADSSGNASFDAAAMRAVESTPSLPAPPPRFAESGLVASIRFQSKECR